MLIRVTATVLALSVGLLPSLRVALCAPALPDPGYAHVEASHVHGDPSGALPHHHDPSTPPRSHLSLDADLDQAVGKHARPERNPTCCGSRSSEGPEAITSTTRPGRKSLTTVAMLPQCVSGFEQHQVISSSWPRCT